MSENSIGELRKEIQRLSSTVPQPQFQSWGAVRADQYKKACREARALAVKARATEQQLQSKLNELKQYWSAA